MPECYYESDKVSSISNETFRIGGIVDLMGADFQQMGQTISALNSTVFDLLSAVNVDNTVYKRDRFKEQGRFFCNLFGLVISHVNNLADWDEVPYSRNTIKLWGIFNTQSSSMWMEDPVHEVFTELQPEDIAENGKPVLWKFDTGDSINTYGSYEGWISFTWYDRNRKKISSEFPEWLKKIILDTNYRTRKKEVVLSQIYKSLHSKTVFDYLKTFLVGSNLYSSGENTEISTQEAASFLPAIIGSADAGLDAIDLLVDVIDYINNEWAQNKELSTLKRIEEGQDNIEEVLTEEEKFSEFLGKSLNIGSSKIVVKENESGTFDFSKFLNLTGESDSELYLSEQILNCLRYNYEVMK